MIISQEFEKILRGIMLLRPYEEIKNVSTEQMLKAILLFVLNGGHCEITKSNACVVCESDIKDSSSLLYDLGADSLDMANICMYAEDFFSIQISEREWKTINSFASLAHFVGKKEKAKIGARPWIEGLKSKLELLRNEKIFSTT